MISIAEAARILSDVLYDPIRPETGPYAAIAVRTPGPDGVAPVVFCIRDEDGEIDTREQDLPLLPKVGRLGLQASAIDEARYRTFAMGVREALSRCDLDASVPHDLLVVNLLRAEGVRTASEFAAAILEPSARRHALAVLEVDDYAAERGVSAAFDPETSANLWSLMEANDESESVQVARAIVERAPRVAVPYLLCLLEDWQSRMWEVGGRSWISDEGRNIDVVVARILEPLVQTATSPSERGRLETLAVAGMFDADHETATVEWMFRT